MRGGLNAMEKKAYLAWRNLRARCRNPNHTRYKYYGGRGIKSCPTWEDFDVFLSDMGPPPSIRHSIDRIDVNGSYCKENCRWADPETQMGNKRGTNRVTINGETKSLAAWARHYGVSFDLIKQRFKRGFPIESVFQKRSLTRKLPDQTLEKIRQMLSSGVIAKEISASLGVPLNTVFKIKQGRIYKASWDGKVKP